VCGVCVCVSVCVILQLKKKSKNCALLGYYASCSGNLLPTFRNNITVPSSGTDWLFRNVGKKLPLLAE